MQQLITSLVYKYAKYNPQSDHPYYGINLDLCDYRLKSRIDGFCISGGYDYSIFSEKDERLYEIIIDDNNSINLYGDTSIALQCLPEKEQGLLLTHLNLMIENKHLHFIPDIIISIKYKGVAQYRQIISILNKENYINIKPRFEHTRSKNYIVLHKNGWYVCEVPNKFDRTTIIEFTNKDNIVSEINNLIYASTNTHL